MLMIQHNTTGWSSLPVYLNEKEYIMKIQKITLRLCHAGRRCSDCGSSDDIIPWGDGWMCRDCGCEWGKNNGY
ncbi:hypothetical protein AIP16_12355 [Salmonella enterica]|nr:hypothetical protein [Salmonella enterica]EBD2224100.1 hypothetical protein [Salmonella enterica subsp. enterica serovar Lexington]EDV3723620.1 hypothetical protein [Salmonella enterica subsp. enterica]EEJ9108638.1 hypothetical protein [Salmonella enterica subsp. enterica serovar Lexington var. 15+]QVC48188.1 hypothetical protein JYN01_18230 [Salmonella enterica subsp. enterica serovar Montevideo str. 4441 H]